MSHSTPYKSPWTDPPIQLDPSAPGETVRQAFLLESILNLFTLPFIFAPRTILSWIMLDPSQAVNPGPVLWARCFGGLVVGALTPALWCGLPRTRRALESRRTVYLLLAGGELALVPLLVDQALKGGQTERGAAISVKVAVMAMGGLIPPFLWRMWVLFVRPEMLGRYREVERKRE